MGGCTTKMKNYKLSNSAIVMVAGSSAGTQPKYYENGYWYKTNNNGYEGLSEYLVSLILSCSDAKEYITYEKCTINDRNGCRSKSFLKENETFISFQRLYDMFNGGNLTDAIMIYSDVEDRIKFVVEFIKEYTDFDCYNYLSSILTLDYFTLNIDRHFHNLGLVGNSQTGRFRAAPIFDNGDALLSNYEKFPADISLEENIENVYGQPFSANLGLQAKALGFNLKIDYKKLDEKLTNEPESRAVDVIRYQMEHVRL